MKLGPCWDWTNDPPEYQDDQIKCVSGMTVLALLATLMTEMDGISENYSLGYVRGLADTHGSLHIISEKAKNNMAITFRSVDEAVMDELAQHLNVLGYDYKRYVQSPGDGRKAQHMLRIHKQDEVRRFCEEVGFRRRDRARRAAEFLARKISLRN